METFSTSAIAFEKSYKYLKQNRADLLGLVVKKGGNSMLLVCSSFLLVFTSLLRISSVFISSILLAASRNGQPSQAYRNSVISLYLSQCSAQY